MLFRSDRKSTRLNSSHLGISYAVFCLKKKKAHTPGRARPPPHTGRGAPPTGGARAMARAAGPATQAPWSISDLPRFFFFLKDRAPPEFYPLPLPDALPIGNPRKARFAVQKQCRHAESHAKLGFKPR